MADGVPYRNYLIIPFARFDQLFWIPTADINWTDHGNRSFHTITGPSDQFTNREDAESYIF